MMDTAPCRPAPPARRGGRAALPRVTRGRHDFGLTMPMLDSQAPWMVGIELAELAYVQAGFDAEEGVEEQLLRRAQSDDKTHRGLETLPRRARRARGAVARGPGELLDQTLDDLKELQARCTDIVAAWRRGDAQQLAGLLATNTDPSPRSTARW